MTDLLYREDIGNKVIKHGSYKGIRYFIKTICGNHPCCYIDVSKLGKYSKLPFDDQAFDDIPVHCGLTYGKNFIIDGDYFILGRFIGWDYGHSGDYMYHRYAYDCVAQDKVWTVEELVAECERAIDWLNRGGD